MEQLDLYDANRIPLGKRATRGIPLKKGEFRLAVHVCIFHPNGDMLIQQRQKDKKEYPNRWDFTAGGNALAGETGTLRRIRACDRFFRNAPALFRIL